MSSPELIAALSDALSAHNAAQSDQERAEALAQIVSAAKALVG